MNEHASSLIEVQRYYGEILKSTGDLQTSACCIDSAPPPHVRRAMERVHEEVKERFYGCGSPIPLALAGAHVLDLGCGTGLDCYVLSQLVGDRGRVIGVDMTESQLAIARKHRDYHADLFGYSNVEFRQGFIEDLAAAGVADESLDLVVSNCVLNLSFDKERVFREIFRVLKPGGELYFADVFAERRVPAALAADPVLRGECLGGALYWEDFRRLMARLGCADFRVADRRRLTLENAEIESRVGRIAFHSVTVRAFKLPLEDRCEDYGQAAIYKGTIPEAPNAFRLDDHHLFETGKTVAVCGNTADMLASSRFAPHFQAIGDKSTHNGLFDCGPVRSPAEDAAACC